jgi:glycerol-3-phosphate O-acyltransferase
MEKMSIGTDPNIRDLLAITDIEHYGMLFYRNQIIHVI